MRSVVDRNVVMWRIPADKVPLWQFLLRVHYRPPHLPRCYHFTSFHLKKFFCAGCAVLFSRSRLWCPCSHYPSDIPAKILCTFLTFHALYMPHPSRRLVILVIRVCIRSLNETHKKMTLSVWHSLCEAIVLPPCKDIPDFSYWNPLCASCPHPDTVIMFV